MLDFLWFRLNCFCWVVIYFKTDKNLYNILFIIRNLGYLAVWEGKFVEDVVIVRDGKGGAGVYHVKVADFSKVGDNVIYWEFWF